MKNKIFGIEHELIDQLNIDLNSDPFEILFILSSNNIQFERIESCDEDGNIVETFKPNHDVHN